MRKPVVYSADPEHWAFLGGADPETGRYRIPSMDEIAAVPWNGYTVVSTFSGGGGSCLGYRMAGYKVLWANEFVDEARATYRLNHPGVILDGRDNRLVTPEDILKATGKRVGEIDLLDGSPPCSAFSKAGVRQKNWHKEVAYSDGMVQNVDGLFMEFARILKGLQPKTFAAENVEGLVMGKAFGRFKRILAALQDCGYIVSARVLDAQWLGVPQKRRRLVFVGVRRDLAEKYGVRPVHPVPEKRNITLGTALAGVVNDPADLEKLRQQEKTHKRYQIELRMPFDPDKPLHGCFFSKTGGYFNLKRESLRCPALTVCEGTGKTSFSGNLHPLENRKWSIPELKRITGVPDDFVVTGDYRRQYERLGRMAPPPMMARVADEIRRNILDKCREGEGR